VQGWPPSPGHHLLPCHLAGCSEIGHLHAFGHQVEASFTFLVADHVEDLVDVPIAVFLDEFQCFFLIDLDHLEFLFCPEIPNDDKFAGGEAESDEKLLGVDESDLDEFEIFRVGVGELPEFLEVVAGAFAFPLPCDLVDDDGVARDVLDDCFGFLPFFLVVVQTVVGLAVLQSL
jgi:hypothetical protein